MGLVDDLRDQIRQGQAVVIAGAGVAMAATRGDPMANWVGLIESGVAWSEEFVPSTAIGWPAAVRGLLGVGNTSSLIAAAGLVSENLGAPDGGSYRRWLRETVGTLKLADASVPAALMNLGVPVATTNYDGLLEQCRPGTEAITWRDGPGVLRVIRGAEKAVVHLHGFWKDPSSVVLGIQSYAVVRADNAFQALQAAMGSVRSLMLVGVGAGGQDPNLGTLLNWIRETFGSIEYRHFRLCREAELRELALEHKGGPIVPVTYGKDHSELASFLEGLVPDHQKKRVGKPMVGMARTPTGSGYWLTDERGGIFPFGDARFFGSTAAITLRHPIVGMATTATGAGYWLVDSLGGVFAFGDATFFGSTGSLRLSKPIVGILATSTGNGYWLVGADGHVFPFGDAAQLGSIGLEAHGFSASTGSASLGVGPPGLEAKGLEGSSGSAEIL